MTDLVSHLKAQKRAMTAIELSDILGLSRAHILKMAKGRRIPSYRLGGAVRFDPGAVAAWLENRSIG